MNLNQIEVILNLTIPQAHYSVSKKVLNAGKHVYSEKPLATQFQKGKELVNLLRQSNIHRFNEEEGIGADICGCFMGNKNNDFNNWYKRNKLLDVTKDDVLEVLNLKKKLNEKIPENVKG